MKLTNKTLNTLRTLIEDLEEAFPNNIPINRDPSIEEFRRLQGHQEVIQYLRNLRDEQSKDEDIDNDEE